MSWKKVELSAKELAEIINVSLARVGQLAKEKVITKLKNGKYSISAIVQYFEFKLKNESTTDTTEELEKERLRKLKRENDIEEKLYAPIGLLTEALEKTVAVVVPILETLPLLLKRNWPEITGDQTLLVKKAIAECRNAMADAKIEIDEPTK